MVAIWALVVGNLVVHEILRPEPWSTAVRAAGYALTALTVGAFFQCVTTHPGSVPEAWRAAALEGNELCVLHHSTGEPVPPRGRYYRRYGETLLAFDHHCWWIGRPIGLLNRKFFVLFVLYAASLSGFGMVVSASDLKETLALPGTNGSMSDTLALLSPFAFGAIGGPMQAAMVGMAISHMEANEITRLVALYFLSVLDLVACLLLGLFGLWHVRMVRRNTLTVGVGPEEARYDQGVAANIRQVFGRQRWLWCLPVWLDDAPSVADGRLDGIHWPTRAPVAGDDNGLSHWHALDCD